MLEHPTPPYKTLVLCQAPPPLEPPGPARRLAGDATFLEIEMVEAWEVEPLGALRLRTAHF